MTLIVQRDRTLEVYVALVIVAGFGVLVSFAGAPALASAGEDGLFWLLSGLVLLGELCPISIPREGGEVDEVTASTAFAFAILIAFGAGPAVIVQCVASIVADVAQRRTAWKVAFNGAQYGISLGAAGLVYEAAGGTSGFSTESIGAYVAAAAVFYVLNTVLVDVAAARVEGRQLLPYRPPTSSSRRRPRCRCWRSLRSWSRRPTRAGGWWCSAPRRRSPCGGDPGWPPTTLAWPRSSRAPWITSPRPTV